MKYNAWKNPVTISNPQTTGEIRLRYGREKRYSGVITSTELLVDSAKKAADGVLDLLTRFHPACVTQDARTRIMAMEFMEGKYFYHATLSVATARELALHLARRTRQMAFQAALSLQDESSSLQNDLIAFREVLLPDLPADEFADLYAQTIAYGLFAARCEFHGAKSTFTRMAAAEAVPKTNPFLRAMFQRLGVFDLDPGIEWIVDDMTAVLANADMAHVLEDFQKQSGREDPVVHFYETFLAAYDPALREVRGVYYTPEPVVSYIVRSVHLLLQSHFGLDTGLTHEKALVLDPATGTGSFLFETVRQIEQHVRHQAGAASWKSYVKENLLERLFGFELLAAPYAVAHLKLALQLENSGYQFTPGERIGVYLTNTLEEMHRRSKVLLGHALTEEADAAAEIKNEKPVLAVIGNPPYSGHSANKSKTADGKDNFIGKLLNDYKKVDGAGLGERNPKWLQDAYVKFIRFAEWRVAKTGHGIVAFITNHGYLDNPTFRGMRAHLMETFDEIWLLDLHGNSRKKETAPDGGKEENVFDIQQGVAILLAVKKANVPSPWQGEGQGEGRLDAQEITPHPSPLPVRGEGAIIHHADVWGLRGQKYFYLLEHDVRQTRWQTLAPATPNYLFIPQDDRLRGEYQKYFSVTDIFPVNSVGIVTARDALTIGFSEDEIWNRVQDFAGLSEDAARENYQLGKDARDWKVLFAQNDLRNSGPDQKNLCKILYRPFDQKYTYYTGKSRGFQCMPRNEVMRHMLEGDNLGLITARSNKSSQMNHFFVSEYISEAKCGEATTQSYLFPLYLYPAETSAAQTGALSFDEIQREPNINPAFTKVLSEATGKTPTPEEIFYYIYAVFHAPWYREKYAEFLRIDFPRVPPPPDKSTFETYAHIGCQLVALHLMNDESRRGEAGLAPTKPHRFEGDGDNVVEKIEYKTIANEPAGSVYINKTQYFENVSETAWNFAIGGYQPAQKWLKDRKNRRLNFEDITHYQQMINALDATAELMETLEKF